MSCLITKLATTTSFRSRIIWGVLVRSGSSVNKAIMPTAKSQLTTAFEVVGAPTGSWHPRYSCSYSLSRVSCHILVSSRVSKCRELPYAKGSWFYWNQIQIDLCAAKWPAPAYFSPPFTNDKTWEHQAKTCGREIATSLSMLHEHDNTSRL